jgi:hypothetical protein
MTDEDRKIAIVELTLAGKIAYGGSCPRESDPPCDKPSLCLFYSNRYEGMYFISCCRHLEYYQDLEHDWREVSQEEIFRVSKS